jgi:hypothetical protein
MLKRTADVALVFVTALMCAAQTKKATKPFVPPAPLYAIDPVISKDPGCARDFAKASLLDGVEQRKALAELVAFECTEMIEGIYRAFLQDSKTVTVNDHAVLARQVHLVALTEVPGTKEPITWHERITAEGWVLDNVLVRMSDEDLKFVLGRSLRNMKRPRLSN